MSISSFSLSNHSIFFFCRPKLTGAFALHRVPYIAVEIVVTGEQESTALAECHACYTAYYVIVTVHGEFLIRSYVEESASCVVRARRECVSVREELLTSTRIKRK